MKMHRAEWISNVLILSGLLLVWSWVAQSFPGRPRAFSSPSAQRLALDTLVFLGAFLLVMLGLRLQRRPGGRWAPAVLAAVVAWLALSALEPLMNRPLPRDPGRFSRALRVAAKRDLAAGNKWPAKSVGIALSGGGYRAAAYHAGVLDTLDRLGVPITNVSTVSGGSIIGAFYALGGEPLEFRDALAEGSFNLRRKLALAQNLLRLPLSGFSRGTVQADLFRQRLALGDARRIRSTCKDCPRLVIGATDLNFGMQVGFLDQGGLLLAYEVLNSCKKYWSQHHAGVTGLKRLDLATQVAISGAFPGAFPRQRVEIETHRQAKNLPGADLIHRTLLLGDGGISDNTGLLLLRAAQEQANHPCAPSLVGWRTDFMIVSDAGAVFGLGGDPGTLASLQRAVDVLSARGSVGFQRREMEKRDLVWLNPSFLPALLLFDSPYYEISPTTASPVQRTTQYSPFYYPDAIVEELGKVLLGEHGPATKAIAEFVNKRKALLPERRIVGLPGVRTREECAQKVPEGGELAANPDLRALACDAVSLRDAFRAEVERLSLVFRDTPTLRDQLGFEVTHDLFALGQAQTLLSWPQLESQLNRAAVGPPRIIPCDPCGKSGPGGAPARGEPMPGASAPVPPR